MEGSSSSCLCLVRWSLEKEKCKYIEKKIKNSARFRITQSAMPLFWVYKFFCFSILFPSVEEKMHHIFSVPEPHSRLSCCTRPG